MNIVTDYPHPKIGLDVNGYTLTQQIADTDNSVVYQATDSADVDYAIKFIKLKPANKTMVDNEISIMQEIDNPFVLQAIDVFDFPPFKCVVMPFSREGDLNTILKRRGKPFDEQTAQNIMKCALKGIQFLHNQNIWHRDIKISNFLLFDSGKTIKLCDLGYASHHNAGEKSHQYLGTPQCAAPEILANSPYDERIDIWSLGVFMYTLLSGSNPFPPFPETTMRRCITRAAYFYPDREWNSISPSAKNLIDSMIKVDPDQRISIQDALSHPWILGRTN